MWKEMYSSLLFFLSFRLLSGFTFEKNAMFMDSWVLSLIAIIISLASASFVIIDKFKVWGDGGRIKKLKKDKAVLHPLLKVEMGDYETKTVLTEGRSQRITSSAHFSKLYFLFQNINSAKLLNKDLASKIDSIKLLDAGKLFEPKAAPNTLNHSVEFAKEVNEVLALTRSYLAEVL